MLTSFSEILQCYLIELYFEKINLLIYYNSWKIYNLLKSIEAAREGVL